MKRLICTTAAAAALLACTAAHAVEWICTTSQQTRIAIAAAELPDGATASGAAVGTAAKPNRARRKIDRTDLVQAYSGQPVLFGNTWLLSVMLPASHPDTRQAFGELGLSPEAAERMASGSSLIDRGIRVVQTPEQMVNKVAINPPAVGYASFFVGARDVAPCF